MIPNSTPYAEANALVLSMLKAGEILAYGVGHSHECGKHINVCTDQGWSPDHWWQEFYPEPRGGSDDSLPT